MWGLSDLQPERWAYMKWIATLNVSERICIASAIAMLVLMMGLGYRDMRQRRAEIHDAQQQMMQNRRNIAELVKTTDKIEERVKDMDQRIETLQTMSLQTSRHP